LCSLLLSLVAASATGQVQVDLRLEKARYLAGEPIVVVIDVQNVGGEAVGYSSCDGDVRLAVAGAERRVRPNIFGCFSGMVSGGGCGGSAPLLPPGQRTTFKYLLTEYDLMPGQYELTAAGKAGVRWTYYPVSASSLPPPPPPQHKETDPVPGAQFARTLPLTIVASTQDALQAALAPLVSEADATDLVPRHRARAAIIESAAPFLDWLIARFAAEEQSDSSAIDALGRIATPGSRTHLRNLLTGSAESRRSAIVLALARNGHSDDAELFTTVLEDATGDQTSRRYAALGLGHIGGDQAVQSLEHALVTAPPELRPSIATALGNTRSRAATPVLIRMFGNNPARNEVCGALTTLTHRAWCDGTADDPAAVRRQWLRRWNESGPDASIFGPDNCPAPPAAPQIVAMPAPAVERATSPAVDATARRSAESVGINEVPEIELTGISPQRPHPSQTVFLATKTPAQVGVHVQLTDARGAQWRIATGVSPLEIVFMLPDEVADGEATVRVGRSEAGVDRLSPPVTFVITSDPLPLDTLAVALMTPVAPGQWTDLVKGHATNFEVRRADRVEIEFRQGDVALIGRATGPDGVHVQVPGRLAPGLVTVRTRTWIEQVASEWSSPTAFRVLERPVPPSVTVIQAGPIRNLVWSSGDAAPAFVLARSRDALVLCGHFPVAQAANLRVQLKGTRETLDLPATDVDGGVRIKIPAQATPGDWRLAIGATDALAAPLEITTVRVM
jgi:HEAT repeat protein